MFERFHHLVRRFWAFVYRHSVSLTFYAISMLQTMKNRFKPCCIHFFFNCIFQDSWLDLSHFFLVTRLESCFFFSQKTRLESLSSKDSTRVRTPEWLDSNHRKVWLVPTLCKTVWRYSWLSTKRQNLTLLYRVKTSIKSFSKKHVLPP